jgi:hypothetical protein
MNEYRLFLSKKKKINKKLNPCQKRKLNPYQKRKFFLKQENKIFFNCMEPIFLTKYASEKVLTNRPP